MPVPYRLFTRFHSLNIRGHDTVNSFAAASNWEDIHREGPAQLLLQKTSSGWDSWACCFKGYEEDGWNQAGADAAMYLHSTIEYLPPWLNSLPFNYFNEVHGPLNFEAFDIKKGTGRYYDGINEWGAYPQRWQPFSTMNVAGHQLSASDIPGIHIACFEAWDHWSDTALALSHSDDIFIRGIKFGIGYIDPSSGGWSNGDGLGLDANLKSCKIAYWNSCCNSFSRYSGPSVGGWPLILSGLGFANADAEINYLSGNSNQIAWGDTTYRLYLEKPDGTVVETLIPTPPQNEFSIDSNSQITIPSMPPLPVGIYQIRIHKNVAGIDIFSYAGDWRTDQDGRMRPGQRLYIRIGKPRTRRIIRTKWVWKKGDLSIFRYYAPIDVRSRDVFYEGMILDMSSFERGTNDLNGLPIFSDLEVTLDNTSQEFSKLLAEYRCKNQLVELWYGFESGDDIIDELIFSGVVADYDKPGSTWRVKLRDIKEKYFSIDIPRYRASIEDYPNIHQNHNGRAIPEVLGEASLTTGAAPGAIEAIYTDTSAFEYLAARGSLYAVPEVYVDGVLQASSGIYELIYKDGGRTYIHFFADQGDAKITFNAQGYDYLDWDSAAGFVQNPAYVILFFLAFFCEMPDIVVDIEAFDTLAALYDSLGYGESGYLIIQENKRASEYLQELLFSYGAKLWTPADNMITIARKDISNFSSGPLFFDQIDALAEPDRRQGFDQAVNYAPIRWGYYPTANLFIGSKLHQNLGSIAALEAQIMPSPAWDFSWIKDESFADLRAQEELLKLSSGEQKISIQLSIERHHDIGILENFRFQDPFGLNISGEGDAARFYYSEKINYDPLRGALTLTGVDLQWLLRQYLVLGDEAEHPDNWSAALDSDRMYAYLCDELSGLFSDGENGKALVNEIEISS
jgi:hypothetical protein